MNKYVDRDKFMQNLEADKYGFTNCIKIGIALDKAIVDIETARAEAIKEFAEWVEKHFREDICTYEVVINGQSYQAFLVDHTFREIRNAPNLFAKEMGVEL